MIKLWLPDNIYSGFALQDFNSVEIKFGNDMSNCITRMQDILVSCETNDSIGFVSGTHWSLTRDLHRDCSSSNSGNRRGKSSSCFVNYLHEVSAERKSRLSRCAPERRGNALRMQTSIRASSRALRITCNELLASV